MRLKHIIYIGTAIALIAIFLAFSVTRSDKSHPATVKCAYLDDIVFAGVVDDYRFDDKGNLVVYKKGIGRLTLSNISCFIEEYGSLK